MIIAARMSNYLRTPEEVAQIVKVSPSTIRKRLLEFAQTQVANKTVAEWRSLSDKELLEASSAEDPPVVKKARARVEALRIEALRKAEEEALAQAEEGIDEEEPTPRKRKRKGKRAVGRRKKRAMTAEPAGEDIEDRDLDELEAEDFIHEMAGVRDNPEEVTAEKRREAQAFRWENRQINDPTEIEGEDLDELISEVDEEGKDDDGGDKEENHFDSDDDVDELHEKEEANFEAWDNRDAAIEYLGKRYFSEEERLLKLTPGQMRERVKSWLKDREPREVVREIQIVETAYRRRDRGARAKPEQDFPDLDEKELDGYYMMNEGDVRARARLWLSHNGNWLEEDKGECLKYGMQGS